MSSTLQRAILVNVIPPERDKAEAMAEFDELVRLVETYGGIVILKILQKRGRPSAKTFLGEGKAHEVAALVRELRADVVVINGFLKANQCNHLINIIPCEVLDRFEMILKIFQKHALSPEAKLQLQIAYYKYEFPKLFGKGAVLSQQAPGVGARAVASSSGGRSAARGPGEKVLEVKRRHLRQQIATLEKKLAHFRQVRSLQRERRKRRNVFTVALVGYTNSGKSSLLQALSKKENIVVEDKLFSTLDTRLARVYTPQQKLVFADTIGFIQDLPPLLFSSFLATLEEVQEADLLLHVIDMGDPRMEQKIGVVEKTLEELGCQNTPLIQVGNKIDSIGLEEFQQRRELLSKEKPQVFVSALHKQGLEELIEAILKLSKIRYDSGDARDEVGSHSLTDRTQASGA